MQSNDGCQNGVSTEAGVLKIGDQVSWRGAWGTYAPKIAKVIGIQIDCMNKYGTEVSEVPWSVVKEVNDNERVVVDLDNSHWAYAFQISPV